MGTTLTGLDGPRAQRRIEFDAEPVKVGAAFRKPFPRGRVNC
jgi:hypothetical protein